MPIRSTPIPAVRPAVLLLMSLGLAGCASLNTVNSDVATFGEWPAGRAAGTFAIERLPSQKIDVERQDKLEAGASAALLLAGFTAAADPATADVIIELGARSTRTDLSPWDDPLWWRWGGGYWHRAGFRGGYGAGFGPGFGPRWGWPPAYDAYYNTQYDQEVGLLIRDRVSGTPLYEARASKESAFRPDPAEMDAMFRAALRDFPNATPKPHNVAVELAASR